MSPAPDLTVADDLTRRCVEARRQIRREFEQARRRLGLVEHDADA